MKILVILRNIYKNQSFFEEEEYLCESDRNVLAEAVALRETYGGSVTALLFAEDVPYNEQTLIRAYTYGVDQTWLICMDHYDFTDTAQFSKSIATTVRHKFSDYDLILFGRLAYDGDAVTVTTMTAQHLELPVVVYCKETGIYDAQNLSCRKYLSAKEEVLLQVPMPALVQSIRDQGLRRQARIADIVRAYSDVEIMKINGDAYAVQEQAESFVGHVCDIEPEDSGQKVLRVLNGVSDVDSARNLIDTLAKLGFKA